jgi:hypothetical protein
MNIRAVALGSPPNSEPAVSPNIHITASATAPSQAPIIVPTHDDFSDALRMAAWIEDAKCTIGEYLLHSDDA